MRRGDRADRAPPSAQEIRVRVKVDPAVVDEVRAAIQDAINSDIGREIAEAIRDAARDTRRAMPALDADGRRRRGGLAGSQLSL